MKERKNHLTVSARKQHLEASGQVAAWWLTRSGNPTLRPQSPPRMSMLVVRDDKLQ